MGFHLLPVTGNSRRPALPRVFDDFFAPFLDTTRFADGGSSWVPRTDVLEDEQGYTLSFELPGLDASAVEVTTEGDTLTVRGERQAREKRDQERWHVAEQRFGSFERSFTFPQADLAEGVDASFENGLLTVRVAKAETACSRRIKVRAR